MEEFRSAADALNDTPGDLRWKKSGAPVRYDPVRLARWLQDRQEDSRTKAPVQVIASWSGRQWLLEAPDHGVDSRAARLITARRNLIHELTAVTGADAEGFELCIRFVLDHPGMKAWTDSVQLKDEGTKLLEQAAEKRRAAVKILSAEGLTGPELGAVFGVSHQRIQQLQTPTKNTAFNALFEAD
jgi:hypothetical protein